MQTLRRADVDGVEVQGLTACAMEIRLDLSRAAMRAVSLVQRAGRLFERIARYGSQSRLSELDFRVWLTSNGLGTSAINRLAERFRTMSYAGDGMVSFAELAANFAWFDAELKCAGAFM